MEIETPFEVNQEKMPTLDRYPFEDITQYYFTPVVPAYDDVSGSEWRVRQSKTENCQPLWTATIKLGNKADGSRREIETSINEGDFGTKPEDIEAYAYAKLTKRRFSLQDGVTVDLLANGRMIAEKEFPSLAAKAAWVPPQWLQANYELPSNRKLADNLKPKNYTQTPVVNDELEDVVAKLQNYCDAIVSVSGMSGSGKSTAAKKIAEVMGAAYLEADHFHIGTQRLIEAYGVANHDLLEAYDYNRVGRVARGLMLGRDQRVPIYDYFSGETTGETTIKPTKKHNVVVDGLYAYRAIKDVGSHHVSLLMNTPLYVSVIRRVLRDGALQPDSRKVSFVAEETLAYLHHYALPSYLGVSKNSRFDFVVS